MKTAFDLGVYCKGIGKSIHYNPFRHKGTAQQFSDWIIGWESV